MPQNGTREQLLSSRNLSTKDLSASAPVVNEVVLEEVFSEVQLITFNTKITHLGDPLGCASCL